MTNKRSAGVIVRLKSFFAKRKEHQKFELYANLFYSRLAKNGWTQKHLWGGEGGI
jgi:hypothetical protein